MLVFRIENSDPATSFEMLNEIKPRGLTSSSSPAFNISSMTASNKNKCCIIYAVSLSPGAVPWGRI